MAAADDAAKLTTFSKVDVSKIDFSEFEEEEDKPDPHKGKTPFPNGISLPGIGRYDPYSDDDNAGAGGLGATEWKNIQATACEERDVGKWFDCSGGANTVMKKLVAAGTGCLDNPRQGWEASIRYTAKVVDGVAFDTQHATEPRHYTLGSGELPRGIETALRSYREGERAIVRLQPEVAFGVLGDTTRGVPADAEVEYDLEMLKMFEVSTLLDGAIRKTVLQRAAQHDWDRPRERAEVRA